MDHQKAWDEIVAEIQRRRSAGETLESIGGRFGRSKSYVHKVLSGSVTGDRVNMDNVQAMLRGLGLKLSDGQNESPLDGFGLVRRVKAMLGAGSSLVTDDEPDGFYAFRLDFLSRLGLKAKPVLFGVIGDSMEPTLKSGDTVLIDEADKTIRAGQLYGVGIGDELHIKRVFVKPDGTVVLKSDNPDHPTWEIPKDERPRIIGRARWVGRIL